MIDAFSPGAFGHALWPGLDVQPQDLKVQKRRFGAFAPGSSDLHAILQDRGIDTLIVTGTATQVCCESTARDAMMLNYKVFFIGDGNATFNDDEHNATLSAMAHAFCDVIDTDAMVATIARPGSARTPRRRCSHKMAVRTGKAAWRGTGATVRRGCRSVMEGRPSTTPLDSQQVVDHPPPRARRGGVAGASTVWVRGVTQQRDV